MIGNLAFLALQQERFEDAERGLERSLELILEGAESVPGDDDAGGENPTEFAACQTRGLEHFNRGEYPKAIEWYARATRLRFRSFYAHYYRGLAYSATGAYQSALEDLKEALVIFVSR